MYPGGRSGAGGNDASGLVAQISRLGVLTLLIFRAILIR